MELLQNWFIQKTNVKELNDNYKFYKKDLICYETSEINASIQDDFFLFLYNKILCIGRFYVNSN